MKELRWFCINNKTKWFWYDIGQNGYYPTIREYCVRGLINFLLFLLFVEIIIWISIDGIQSPLFELIRQYSVNTQKQDIIYIFYGAVVGIAGSLLFGSISNPDKSVASRIRTSLTYLIYYAGLFYSLNFMLLFYFITRM